MAVVGSWRETGVVGSIQAYPVVSFEGKVVGRVSSESETALVVECGRWPRRGWRALPRQFASVDEQKRCVLMQVSREMLVQSPKLKQGVPVDEKAVAAWWGLESW